jgi:hypothetical protein
VLPLWSCCFFYVTVTEVTRSIFSSSRVYAAKLIFRIELLFQNMGSIRIIIIFYSLCDYRKFYMCTIYNNTLQAIQIYVTLLNYRSKAIDYLSDSICSYDSSYWLMWKYKNFYVYVFQHKVVAFDYYVTSTKVNA